MNTQQSIYLELIAAFRNKDIEFALPERHVFMDGKIEQEVKQIPEKDVEAHEPVAER
jgi:hypothetical protein